MNVLIIKILFNNFSFQFSHLILKIIYKKKFKFILKDLSFYIINMKIKFLKYIFVILIG